MFQIPPVPKLYSCAILWKLILQNTWCRYQTVNDMSMTCQKCVNVSKNLTYHNNLKEISLKVTSVNIVSWK